MIPFAVRHPIQWNDGRRYRRKFGARSYTKADLQAVRAHADQLPYRNRAVRDETGAIVGFVREPKDAAT